MGACHFKSSPYHYRKIYSKNWAMWIYHGVMCPNNTGGIANSVDPDQIAPPEAVWFASSLFAPAYLSENLGSLR